MLWAAGVRQVELAIGVKPSADTVDVLRQYQQQGMQYRAHHAIVWEEQRSFNLADRFDARYFERLTDWLVSMGITTYSILENRNDCREVAPAPMCGRSPAGNPYLRQRRLPG